MASQVFYRKWRPRTLAEVVGQEPVTQTLRNALITGHVSHAYLFCGPRGTGKTSTARSLAKAINCLKPQNGEPCNACAMCQSINEARAMDIIEVDAASNTGVEDIRSLREKVNYSPTQAKYKVYIIDEVHMLSNSASNALLKTLEEPPPHVIFILATTEVHKLLPTILSRCQRFDFKRLSQSDVIAKLGEICQSEKIKVEPEALRLIAKSATGSLRDAENLLEQMTTYYGTEIGLRQVEAVLGITGDQRAKELTRHIINKDVSAGIAAINAVSSDGIDLRQFNREVVGYLRALLLTKTGASEAVDLPNEDKTELKALATKASLPQLLKSIKLFGQLELGFDNYSTLPLELALVDSTIIEAEVKEIHHRAAETEPAAPPKAVKPASPEPPSPPKAKVETPPQVPKGTMPVEPEPRQPSRVAEPAATTTQPKPAAVKPEPPVVSFAEPAKAATPATPTTPPSPLEAGSDIERIKMNWRQIIEQAPADVKKTAAIAILRSAGVKPVALNADVVSLVFKYRNHKEQIEKIENQRIVARIIGNFIGRPCRIQCTLEDNHLIKEAQSIGAQIINEEKE